MRHAARRRSAQWMRRSEMGLRWCLLEAHFHIGGLAVRADAEYLGLKRHTHVRDGPAGRARTTLHIGSAGAPVSAGTQD